MKYKYLLISLLIALGGGYYFIAGTSQQAQTQPRYSAVQVSDIPTLTSIETSTDTPTETPVDTSTQTSDANTAPDSATAQCNDGTYSFSQHRQGTCSHHDGVAQWL